MASIKACRKLLSPFSNKSFQRTREKREPLDSFFIALPCGDDNLYKKSGIGEKDRKRQLLVLRSTETVSIGISINSSSAGIIESALFGAAINALPPKTETSSLNKPAGALP